TENTHWLTCPKNPIPPHQLITKISKYSAKHGVQLPDLATLLQVFFINGTN
ncbi:12751_t:CDS:1, partial [Racocetra persica]